MVRGYTYGAMPVGYCALRGLHQRAWFGTLREFGEFWAARDRVAVDVERQGKKLQITLKAPVPVAGLTLRLPADYHVASASPRDLSYTQKAGQVVINNLSGDATLTLNE